MSTIVDKEKAYYKRKVLNNYKMKSVLVVGYFGYQTKKLNGQTVKTVSLYRLLSSYITDLKFYDTQEFQVNKKSIFSMLKEVFRCKTLVYLPAHNNLKWIFPVIFIISSITGMRIHYFVIGGWLKEFLSDKPIHRWMLSKISGIHPETQFMKKELEEQYNYKNISLFPNFRFFDKRKSDFTKEETLRLVFMARINRMKGLDMIFELGNFIRDNNLDEKISIDFYGPVFQEDKDYFERNLSCYSFMRYAGLLQPEDIHYTLEKYDAMLFPTHYYTEGLPGSIVDAYISGVPVVATCWKHASEFIEDSITGIIIPFEDGQKEFDNAIIFLMSNRDKLLQMKMNARCKSLDFSAEYALSRLNEILSN